MDPYYKLKMPPQPRRSTLGTGQEPTQSSRNSALPIPTVSRENGLLLLHFNSNYIQSQMIVDEPETLALAYTRTMMAFEMFKPRPRSIALIGLGGGSIAKWCYRHHPASKLTVVELNPHVIAVRDAFKIPRDDRRFQIRCEDGAKFVAKTSRRFDVLLVDCFSGDHLPEELCSLKFYADCKRCLTASGLLVVNLCGKYRRILSRIQKSFGTQVLLSTDVDGNTVVFACKGALLWAEHRSADSLRNELGKFERKYGLGRAIPPSV